MQIGKHVPLATVVGADSTEPDGCCACCHSRLCAGGLTVMGALTAATLVLSWFFWGLLYPGGNLLSASVAFGINLPVFYLIWYRNHRESATLDMLVKIFGWTYWIGMWLAVLAETALGYFAARAFVPKAFNAAIKVEQHNEPHDTTPLGQYGWPYPLLNSTETCDILYVTFPNGHDDPTNATGTGPAPAGAQHTAGLLIFLLFMAFWSAGFVEESVKLIAARCKCCCKNPCCLPGWRSGKGKGDSGLRDPYSMMIYIVAAAAGFSTAENTKYLFEANRQGFAHGMRPDCYDAVPLAVTYSMLVARVALCYPGHLLWGAMTGCQLIRRHLTPERLHWFWVLVPAVLTHGLYDFALFCVATYGPKPDKAEQQEAEEMDKSTLAVVQTMMMLSVGYVYYLVPIWWLRWRLRQANLAQIMTREGQAGLLVSQQMAYAGTPAGN